MWGKLAKIFKSKNFKRIALVLGIAFLILTFFISLEPESFLKFGYFGVFVFNLFGPGTLLVPVFSQYMNIFGLAVASASGMTLNDSASWLVGKSGDIIIPRSKKILRIEKLIQRFGPWALFFLSLAPLPYDFVGLIAGYLNFSYRAFFIPSFLGKFLRFLFLGIGTVVVIRK